jgi:hypothetical protein
MRLWKSLCDDTCMLRVISINNQGMWDGLYFPLPALYAKLRPRMLDGSLLLFLRVGWSGGGGRKRLCVWYQAFLRVPMRVA